MRTLSLTPWWQEPFSVPSFGWPRAVAARIRRRMKLRALRGATTVEANEPEAILSATEELVREVMERNSIDPDDMVSCIFTCTNDLDAEFPAVAARNLGLSSVPLLCAREIDVPGALPRVIRLLLHCYADPGSDAKHVYLREAEALRKDLQGAQ
jgi:chorismate mutase